MRADECRPRRMGDQAIRVKLDAWIATEFAYDKTTIVYHELAMPRPSARIDVAVVNGFLAGFEIKSDLDNLIRLPRQVASFGYVFERATLVTTSMHVEKARKLLPDWWGIMIMRDEEKFCRVRRGRVNRDVSSEHALHLLSRTELLRIAYQKELCISRNLRKADIARIIAKKGRTSEIMFCIRESLKSRIIPTSLQTHHMAVDIEIADRCVQQS